MASRNAPTSRGGITQPTSGDDTSSRLPPQSVAITGFRIAIASRIVPGVPVPAHDASTTRFAAARSFGMAERTPTRATPPPAPAAVRQGRHEQLHPPLPVAPAPLHPHEAVQPLLGAEGAAVDCVGIEQ